VEKLLSLTKFIADAFFLPAKIVKKTPKHRFSFPAFRTAAEGKG
jgi:hypothetical protein